MGNSVGNAALRTHPNTVRSVSDLGRPVVAKVRMSSDAIRTEPNDDKKAEMLAILEEARIEARLSQKEMQIESGASKSTFSEAWTGASGNVAVHWLLDQPAAFWIAFYRLMAIRKGITQDTEDAHRKREIDETADALFQRLVDRLTCSPQKDGQ